MKTSHSPTMIEPISQEIYVIPFIIKNSPNQRYFFSKHTQVKISTQVLPRIKELINCINQIKMYCMCPLQQGS